MSTASSAATPASPMAAPMDDVRAVSTLLSGTPRVLSPPAADHLADQDRGYALLAARGGHEVYRGGELIVKLREAGLELEGHIAQADPGPDRQPQVAPHAVAEQADQPQPAAKPDQLVAANDLDEAGRAWIRA